jgi:hypothetical protein
MRKEGTRWRIFGLRGCRQFQTGGGVLNRFQASRALSRVSLVRSPLGSHAGCVCCGTDWRCVFCVLCRRVLGDHVQPAQPPVLRISHAPLNRGTRLADCHHLHLSASRARITIFGGYCPPSSASWLVRGLHSPDSRKMVVHSGLPTARGSRMPPVTAHRGQRISNSNSAVELAFEESFSFRIYPQAFVALLLVATATLAIADIQGANTHPTNGFQTVNGEDSKLQGSKKPRPCRLTLRCLAPTQTPSVVLARHPAADRDRGARSARRRTDLRLPLLPSLRALTIKRQCSRKGIDLPPTWLFLRRDIQEIYFS